LSDITSLKIKDKNADAIDKLLKYLEPHYVVIPTSKKMRDPEGYFYIFVSISERNGS
jgi:hypothetical protein